MTDKNIIPKTPVGSPAYCAYCGEVTDGEAPDAVDKIREHIEVCPKHPIAKYKREIIALRFEISNLMADNAYLRLHMQEFDKASSVIKEVLNAELNGVHKIGR